MRPCPRPLAVSALALLLTAFAPMIQGEPIPSRDIILEGDPNDLTVSGVTDRRGIVHLPVRPSHSYALLLPEFTRAPYTVVARVELGRTTVTSEALAPGGPAPAWFRSRDGRRMALTIPPGVRRVRITLTEGPTPRPAAPRG